MKIRSILIAGSFVVGLIALPWLAQAATEDFTPVDASECEACHADSLVKMRQTMHGAQNCAACHKGAAEHLKAQTEGGDAPAPSFKNLTAQEVDSRCLSCHEKGNQAMWSGSMHDRRDVSCLSCHSVHNFESLTKNLKTRNSSEICENCHQAIRAKEMRTSHHPVREGILGCESCHNPHDGSRPKMIKADWTNDLCYQCHTEKRGPFLWEHAPVRENCLNCHDPHGSNHDKLLVAKMPYLCQRCHLNTRHPGTLYDAANGATTAASPTNRAVEHACKNCHQNIHGSNAPSGPYLGR